MEGSFCDNHCVIGEGKKTPPLPGTHAKQSVKQTVKGVNRVGAPDGSNKREVNNPGAMLAARKRRICKVD